MKSLSKAKLKLFASLQHKKFRYQHCMFVTEGKKMFQEAYQSGWDIEAIILRERQDLYSKFNIPDNLKSLIYETDKQSFRQLSTQTQSEGIITIMRFPSKDYASILHHSPPLVPGPSFVLDQLQDPGNVGTIMRTLDWLGIKNLICGVGTVDVLNPKCLRASMGGVFRMNIQYIHSLVDFVKEANRQTWIADMEGKSLKDVSFGKNDIIVLGNEANGVSSELKQLKGTQFVSIARKGDAESLNVSAAGAILAWELSKM